MREQTDGRRFHRVFLITVLLTFSCYVEKVLGSHPPESISKGNQQWNDSNYWSIFEGSSGLGDYKRSIATLAKNGQLPTFQSPGDVNIRSTNAQKKNVNFITKNLNTLKRNSESLVLNRVRNGKRTYLHNSDKRNVEALARNGYLRIVNPAYEKKKEGNFPEDNYNTDSYQHLLTSLSEKNSPWFVHDHYVDDKSSLPQSYYKRNAAVLLRQDSYMQKNSGRPRPTPRIYEYYEQNEQDSKRNSDDLTDQRIYHNHGKKSLADQKYDDGRLKRTQNVLHDNCDNGILSKDCNVYNNDYKRSLGNIPLTRISELGELSQIKSKIPQPPTPTLVYRRWPYLIVMRTSYLPSEEGH